MGIIKAAINAVGGGLADSWLEVIEPSPMGDNTLICPGQLVSQNGKSQNKKGSENIVSNGSVIHVYDNQMMILIDGGKIVDFTAEPGYFKVNNSSMPSLFCGQFGDSIKETFNRIKYGGIPSQAQRVFYINLQEIKGIPFGTSTPVNYFDNFYNSELMLRAHGTYSIKVVEPFKFYQEVIPREAVTENKSVDFADVRAQYNEEFVGALGSAINQYSADGERISFIKSKQRLIGQYMAQTLDEEWTQARGMEVFAVGMDVSYTEDSQELINMRNKGAMLSDAAVQQGYVAANISEGRLKCKRCNGRLYGHGHWYECRRKYHGRLSAESAVPSAAADSATATGSATADSRSAGRRCSRRLMDLLMRCGKHRQVLLGVRFKEARGSQKAFLHKLRI